MSPLGRRGIALMLVLWLVVLLGVIAVAIIPATRGESTLALNLHARATARYAAESGLEAAKARLVQLMASGEGSRQRALALRDLSDTFRELHEVQLGAATFGVEVEDLNARLDLNSSDEPTLLAFFSQFADGREASRVSDALLDWRDADDLVRAQGAEAVDYRRAGLPLLPSNRQLRDVDELRHVMGVTDSLADAVEPYVTVDGDGHMNINSAPESVLAALPGLNGAGARNLASRRRAGDVFTSPMAVYRLFQVSAATPFPFGQLAVEPTRVLVVSRGWLAGHPLTHEIRAVYELPGRKVVLRGWRERDL